MTDKNKLERLIRIFELSWEHMPSKLKSIEATKTKNRIVEDAKKVIRQMPNPNEKA